MGTGRSLEGNFGITMLYCCDFMPFRFRIALFPSWPTSTRIRRYNISTRCLSIHNERGVRGAGHARRTHGGRGGRNNAFTWCRNLVYLLKTAFFLALTPRFMPAHRRTTRIKKSAHCEGRRPMSIVLHSPLIFPKSSAAEEDRGDIACCTKNQIVG